MITYVVTTGLVGCAFAGGFVLGSRRRGSAWHSRIFAAQIEEAQARRRLHDVTRYAFVTMSQRALQHRVDATHARDGTPREDGPRSDSRHGSSDERED